MPGRMESGGPSRLETILDRNDFETLDLMWQAVHEAAYRGGGRRGVLGHGQDRLYGGAGEVLRHEGSSGCSPGGRECRKGGGENHAGRGREGVRAAEETGETMVKAQEGREHA
jgi:hypothetical protein